MNRTDELRTARIESLVTPAELALRYPVTPGVATHVTDSRRRIEKILNGEDKRLLVIIGPCSIHDLTAAMEYATRLQSLRNQYQSRLEIVMRTYFEKPRTVVGWKGLISDPDLNGSYRVNHGLELARKLLLQVNELGVPTATEFLDMVTGQFIADLISWGAIGARTTESQIHREMASALSCPVGFKNGTDGNTRIAGIMAESFLREGTQKIVGGQPLTYGQSITDPCLGWEDTERLVEKLASAVDTRF
ncbi:TPA: 3-deoxy-7-phosphoheptulonate synthase [Escherichia coli]